MFGHGVLDPDFVGMLVLGVGVVAGADVPGVAEVLVAVGVELVVAAEAPAIPAAVPPVASAPATIVAWSIFDIRIKSILPILWTMSVTILRGDAHAQRCNA
jgi:hypothetical protein